MFVISVLLLMLMVCVIKLMIPRCRSNTCLVGKTIILTGGNKGLGFQTSLGLAARGCKLIIACRSNAEKERDEIVRLTDNPNIIVKHLDLASFTSVREFAKEIHDEYDKIDVLINNAGQATFGTENTEDGFNPVIQVNLLGPFLLSHLLIDLLKNAGNARIIFVSSILALIHNLNLKNVRGIEPKGNVDYILNYANTKAGLVIISNEFAERLKVYGITSNALHPGLVMTDIFNTVKKGGLWLFVLCYIIVSCFTMTAVDGAQTTLTVAMSSKYKTATGKLLGIWNVVPRKTKDKTFCKEIWEHLEMCVQMAPAEKI